MAQADGYKASHRVSEVHADGKAALWCLALICGCFTLVSEGYLEWLYRLIDLGSPVDVDWCTLVVNYVFQGLGMLVAALLVKTRPHVIGSSLLLAAIVLHLAFVVPAVLATTWAAVVALGLAAALFGGVIQAFYLTRLALLVRPTCRGVVFGVGYACSICLTWLLSLARGAAGQGVPLGLVACVALTVAVAALAVVYPAVGRRTAPGLDNRPDGRGGQGCVEDAEQSGGRGSLARAGAAEEPFGSGSVLSAVVLACGTILFMSVETSLGFGFPSADIDLGVDLEFSRLFYAAGLVIAGIVADRNRAYGVACGMAATVTPFALLALSGEPVPAIALWSLGYLLYGFFALFRALLFVDMAAGGNKVFLAGFGLMFGRFGDAAGSAFCISSGDNVVVLVGFAGVMLVCAVVMALQLWIRVFASRPSADSLDKRAADEDRFDRFAQYYDLSRREQDVLRQALARRTNAEIAESLFVSESTVKFHMRNLLNKTDCKNRVALRELYADWH